MPNNTPRSNATSELETNSTSRPSTPTAVIAAQLAKTSSQEDVLNYFLLRAYAGYKFTAEQEKEIKEKYNATTTEKTEISPNRDASTNASLLAKLGLTSSGLITAADNTIKAAAEKAISPAQTPRKA